jgi:Ni2+-binding GTPase involved in maturation of urease and hydrogenase
VISKVDLSTACEFDREMALRNIGLVNPRARIHEVSAKMGLGMDHWCAHLRALRLDLCKGLK